MVQLIEFPDLNRLDKDEVDRFLQSTEFSAEQKDSIARSISDFNALHSRKHDHEVQLYTFDVLAMAGDDLRGLPLHLRKTNLERLLARRLDGLTVAPFERGEIGPDLFLGSLPDGPRGLVSKHRDRPYRGGRQKHWISYLQPTRFCGYQRGSGFSKGPRAAMVLYLNDGQRSLFTKELERKGGRRPERPSSKCPSQTAWASRCRAGLCEA
ncbi:hypothetical protein SAMN05216573_12153 [Bradyrhizobium sp. Rc3b]|uniref:hypothetical protein n=1 Tax=Bradyrhizobium sp. Rc3b TaxID=1855322 RepID=UPI0008E884E0|nr:hypothetical protein SAMN05216573_12153 [Bradyrhizobium sp. Rc3b]